MDIKTAAVSAPVTALEVQDDYILSGEASYLHVYHLTTGEHLDQRCLLELFVIHGIRKGCDSLYAVFGQKALSVVRIELGETVQLSVLCGIAEFPDWILDVAFLGNGGSPPSPSCLGLVLAHNSAVFWDWKQKSSLQHVHCAENCILYSAKLLGNSWPQLTVAAGTVFNQVVLWEPTGPQDAEGRVPVQRRLSGHRGVIFNLSYHADRKLLCSVSDDRSVRLWSLDPANTPGEPSGAARSVMYGHSARVWDARILDRSIVSVGEDATCCVWNCSGEIIHRFTSHKGRSIWSLAVNEDRKLIVTGGGDGSIRLWPADAKPEERITTEELSIQNDVPPAVLRASESTRASDLDDGFNPRQLAVLDSGQIVVLTLNGCLLCYALRSKQWVLLSHDPNYQSYCLLSVCPDHQVAALGNIRGRLKIVALDNGETLLEMAAFTGKIFSLCWENESNLLASGPDGVVIWLTVERSGPAYCQEEIARFRLPPAPQRWLTAAALVPREDGALVCGDRRGSLLLYRRLPRTTPEDEPLDPTHSLPYIHGKAGVTQVCHHAGCVYSTGRDGTYRQYRIRGARLQMLNTFRVYKGFNWIEGISFTATEDVFVTGFHASSFIVWSQRSGEKLVQIQCGGGHRAWGFATCQLLPTPGEAVPTGGDGSRSAPRREDAAAGGSGSTSAVFACIKAKRIVVCTAPGENLQQHPILKESLHGRRVACIKYLATVRLPIGECAVCATGSEDNAVNLVAVMFPASGRSTLHVLHRLQVHISSVRALAACPVPTPATNSEDGGVGGQAEVAGGQAAGQRLLLFSVGGRRAVQCWRVTIPTDCPIQDQAPGWLKSTCAVEHLASHGNTDNVKQRRWLKRHGRTVDPETRFMSVCVWRGSQPIGQRRPQCILGVAGSDACLRLFAFDEQTKQLRPLLAINSRGCCLLTTLCLTHEFPWGPSPILLAGGTDGSIAFWDVRGAARERGNVGGDCTDEDELSQGEPTGGCEVGQFDADSQWMKDPGTTDDGTELRSRVRVHESCDGTPELCTTQHEELCGTTAELRRDVRDLFNNTKEPCSTSVAPSNHATEPFSHNQDPCRSTTEPSTDTEGPHSKLTTNTCTDRASNSLHTSADLDRSKPRTAVNHADSRRSGGSPVPRATRNHGIAETDASWDSEADFGKPLLTLKAHQSGVNALCVSRLDSQRYLMASGGDDNAIQLHLLSVSSDEPGQDASLTLEHSHCIPCAHAAQVTGLSFIGAGTLVSSSVDQRLNVWRIVVNADKTSVTKVESVGSRFTLIADSAGTAQWPLRHGGYAVAVCGQGVQVLQLTTSQGTRPDTTPLP